MRGIFHEGKWYEDTGMICKRCGHPVYMSDLSEYVYQCFHCDEDLYSFETEENPGISHPVVIARPIDGITINTEIEYILDEDGEIKVFASQKDAEKYLETFGYDEEDMDYLYFIDASDTDNTDDLESN